MKIATWNINSVRVRLEQLLTWLKVSAPDIACLQELKCTDEQFPFAELTAAGYHSSIFGQKAYNGVAVLSREKPELVERDIRDGFDDDEARVIAATVSGVKVISVYAPNGQEALSEAYERKLHWYSRFQRDLLRRFKRDEPFILCGDFNVAPEDLDVWDTQLFNGKTLFTEPEKRALRELKSSLGLTDIFRKHVSGPGHYSWWDYRLSGFKKNHGLRIDHLLATAPLAARSTGAGVDRFAREGTLPSDHAPVWAQFSAESRDHLN